MRSEIMRQIVETIEADVQSRPSAIEFEMAYQARIAIAGSNSPSSTPISLVNRTTP
jgi:hypothetical protein